MPSRSTFKSLLIETALFIGLFVLAGHLSINFWERYVIQSELSLMKCSLHSLKDTINNIGKAYDNLQKEINAILKTEYIGTKLDMLEKKHNHKQFLDRRRLHELQMQVIIDAKNKKHNHYSVQEKNDTKKPIRNATTITRKALKPTAVGEEKKYNKDLRVLKCDDKFDKTQQCNDDPTMGQSRF
ncbi:uncharacterized protein LOC114240590 [Bombyx mandarina]|uniref:Uncharacterized protein LOC114240590 n=1 Tax=Bombyx mandarina TaxID=7092 RepID=A0A6J2JEV8_BOMMA|nr:uncharacterized protein LOC114240590 [Bombyx mandarina]